MPGPGVRSGGRVTRRGTGGGPRRSRDVTPYTPTRSRTSAPVLHTEGPAVYQAAYQRNRPFAQPGPYQTPLSPDQETAFRLWANTVKLHTGIDVPLHGKTDYDYRGYFKATGGKIPKGHYPDTFKTPRDSTFSRESEYATKDNPFVWRGNKLVDRRSGLVVFEGSG
jgi:hypothetical protein